MADMPSLFASAWDNLLVEVHGESTWTLREFHPDTGAAINLASLNAIESHNDGPDHEGISLLMLTADLTGDNAERASLLINAAGEEYKVDGHDDLKNGTTRFIASRAAPRG